MSTYKPDFSVKRMRLSPALSESNSTAQGHQVKSDWFAQRTLPVAGRGQDKLFFSSSAGGGIINVTDQLFFNDSLAGSVSVNSSDTSFSGSRKNALLANLSDDSGMLQSRFSYDYTGFTYGMTDLDPGSLRYDGGTSHINSSGEVEDLSGKFIPWHDKSKFNAVVYMQDSGSLQWPIVNDDPSAIDILDYNGVIEPLTIRSVIGMTSTFMGDNLDPEPHSIRGGVSAQYVEEQYNRFNLVTNFFNNKESNKNYPFAYVVDWHLYEGFSFTVPDSTYTDNDDITGEPFIEKTIEEIIYQSVSDKKMQDYLIYSTTGSFDGRPKKDSKSKPCGFTYENSKFGTDSLAFGGLLK